MRSKEELIAYKHLIEMLYGPCDVMETQRDSNVFNSIGTSEREAEGEMSWIDYWRAMTGKYESPLSCASCGKAIYADCIPNYMSNFYRLTSDTAEQHVACGGHISLGGPPPSNINHYIIPLCPECNAKRGEMIPIRKGTLVCKELGAHIKKKE